MPLTFLTMMPIQNQEAQVQCINNVHKGIGHRHKVQAHWHKNYLPRPLIPLHPLVKHCKRIFSIGSDVCCNFFFASCFISVSLRTVAGILRGPAKVQKLSLNQKHSKSKRHFFQHFNFLVVLLLPSVVHEKKKKSFECLTRHSFENYHPHYRFLKNTPSNWSYTKLVSYYMGIREKNIQLLVLKKKNDWVERKAIRKRPKTNY